MGSGMIPSLFVTRVYEKGEYKWTRDTANVQTLLYTIIRVPQVKDVFDLEMMG